MGSKTSPKIDLEPHRRCESSRRRHLSSAPISAPARSLCPLTSNISDVAKTHPDQAKVRTFYELRTLKLSLMLSAQPPSHVSTLCFPPSPSPRCTAFEDDVIIASAYSPPRRMAARTGEDSARMPGRDSAGSCIALLVESAPPEALKLCRPSRLPIPCSLRAALRCLCPCQCYQCPYPSFRGVSRSEPHARIVATDSPPASILLPIQTRALLPCALL